MAFPQGIPFRATTAYVTDSGDDSGEAPDGVFSYYTAANYPRTTAQGNNCGWETVYGSDNDSRNRNTAGGRLAGHQFVSGGRTEPRWRLDLPSAGDYNIRLAIGDYNYSGTRGNTVIQDGTTDVLSVTGTTTAGQRWIDATGVERTSVSDWNNNNAASLETFASTILRFRLDTVSGAAANIAYLNVSAGGAAAGNPRHSLVARQAVMRASVY